MSIGFIIVYKYLENRQTINKLRVCSKMKNQIKFFDFASFNSGNFLQMSSESAEHQADSPDRQSYYLSVFRKLFFVLKRSNLFS